MDVQASEIAVLLVDDDVDWVETTGAALERSHDALSVITATGGWEALDVFEDRAFDCVVCDYRMPDFDGIALLERIRAEHGDVPFILVTGAGSETVASRAISSRVTDYFIKEPGRDQSGTLGIRIRTAVDAYRTRRELDAARRRFTELFRRVPDPVAVVGGGGRIREVNDAFADVFGVDPMDAAGSTPDAPLAGAVDGAGGSGIGRVSMETERGRREFVVRRFPLGGDDAGETGLVFTDVTRHVDRERELERFYELSTEVRELLLSATSRSELKRGICETVVSSVEEARAVLVESEADGLRVMASAGDVGARLEETLCGPETGTAPDRDAGHPIAATLADGEPRYVPDLEDVREEWAEGLRARGVYEVLAIPVERAGLAAGAFVVCSGSASSLQEEARARLAGLVSSLGDAMSLVDRAAAVTAERVVRVTLSVDDDAALLSSISRAADAPLDVVAEVRRDDDASVYLDVEEDDPEAACEEIRAVDAVAGAAVVAEGERARLRVDARSPGLRSTLADRGAAVRSVAVSDGRITATVDVPLSGDVAAVVSAVESGYESVTVRSIRTVERGPDEPGDALPLRDLTEKQRRALRTAYHEGYFERPRARSADEVASALGISRSTFLQHLRAAERKLLARVVGTGPPDAGG